MSLFILPKTSSITNNFVTFIFMLFLSYSMHYLAHAFPANTSVHLYHHNNTNIFSQFIQILLEFYALIILIPFSYLLNINILNPWIIIFGYIFYTTVHNINYSIFHVNNTHENHHLHVETNIGPDICDIIFDTKGGTDIENTDHYIVNVIASLIIVLVLNKIWVYSNDSFRTFYQITFEIIFVISGLVLLFFTYYLSEEKDLSKISDRNMQKIYGWFKKNNSDKTEGRKED